MELKHRLHTLKLWAPYLEESFSTLRGILLTLKRWICSFHLLPLCSLSHCCCPQIYRDHWNSKQCLSLLSFQIVNRNEKKTKQNYPFSDKIPYGIPERKEALEQIYKNIVTDKATLDNQDLSNEMGLHLPIALRWFVILYADHCGVLCSIYFVLKICSPPVSYNSLPQTNVIKWMSVRSAGLLSQHYQTNGDAVVGVIFLL